MSIYLHNPGDRYRRRAARRTVGFFSVVFFLAFFFVCGYWVGGFSSSQKILSLRQERDVALQQHTELQNEITQIRAESQTANLRLEQLRANYEEILPDGELKNLVDLLRKQLDEGIDQKRLESVIRSARPPQNCSEPTNRSFVISTKAYKGPDSKITIDSGTISISGHGESVINPQGSAEAWFDPSKAVTIKFSSNEGQTEEKTDMLPFYYSMVVGNKEYRFTIAQGEQSSAKITYDYCDYP